MEEDEDGGAEAVGQDLELREIICHLLGWGLAQRGCSSNLDVGPWPFAASGAGGGQSEVGFDVCLDFGGLGAEEEEYAEQREGEGPRVEGVHCGGCDRCEDARRGEGFVGPGSVYQRQRRWDGDLVSHGYDRERMVEKPWVEVELHDAGFVR